MKRLLFDPISKRGEEKDMMVHLTLNLMLISKRKFKFLFKS